MAIIEKLAMIARHRLLNGLSNRQEASCFFESIELNGVYFPAVLHHDRLLSDILMQSRCKQVPLFLLSDPLEVDSDTPRAVQLYDSLAVEVAGPTAQRTT